MASEPRGRVLVVDDEENILTSLRGVLEDEGHDVELARHGEEALARLQGTPPDVILLDIWMPGLDGMEVLRQIKASHPDVQVIMVTGHGTIETAVQATKIGAFDFFEKPLSVPAVRNAVDRALAHRRLLLENRHLRLEQLRPHPLLGGSGAMAVVRRRIEELAPQDGPVAFVGERGAGKKLCARLLHAASLRRDRPFLVFSASAGAPEGIGDRLFGRPGDEGPFFRAAGGSIYVDGAHRLPADVRQRLEEPALRRAAGLPRLFYGLTSPGASDVPSVVLPPLRERPGDVPVLARFFLEQLCTSHGSPEKSLDPEAERVLAAYEWPSNVEELKNVIERLVLTIPGDVIRLADLPVVIQRAASGPRDEGEVSFEEAERLWERQFLSQALERHGGDVSRAARHLHMTTQRLENKLRAAGLAAVIPPAGGRRQRTLARSVVLSGVGLHSGGKTGLILNPLPPDAGIVFGSISHGDTVPAHVDFVDRTGYATGLRRGRAVAKTIEHLMATLHAYGITNLLVKVADEVPIMDGSAQDFCQLLEDGGIAEQDAFVQEIVVDRTFTVGHPEDPDAEGMTLSPADAFEVSYDLHYPKPVGHQRFDWCLRDADAFRQQIAPARTFGFLKDIAMLEEMGLGTGGRLSNFILIDDEKVVNTELRFPDELARHKILDITGDFYLLGRPIRGRIHARKTGHADNVAMLRLVQAAYGDPTSGA